MGEKDRVLGPSGHSALSEDPPYAFGPNLTEQGGAKSLARADYLKHLSFLESKMAHIHPSP